MASLSDAIAIGIKIKADASQAESEIKKFKGELKGLDSTDALANLTTSTGLSAQGFNNLKVGALAAVAGIGAIVGVAGTVTTALFSLTKSTADFGSEIFDASQKTGLGAEALSAMKLAADQSGTSLDAITTGAARFARTIQDAANGSDKAQAKLDNLKVTSKNLDEALAQALSTIVKLPAGVEQMTAAQDAFGRSGTDLLPFIKSFDGDLVKLIRTAKELGVTMSDEDAAAADKLGDQLDTLSAQVSGVGRRIGIELLPSVNKIAKAMSDWLTSNKAQVSVWASNFSTNIEAIVNRLDQLKAKLEEFDNRTGLIALLLRLNAVPLAALIGDEADRVRQQKKNVVAPAIDYSRPQDKTKEQRMADDEEAKKEAEERAKARAQAYEKELAALSKKNALLLAGEKQTYAFAQQILEDHFLKQTELTDKHGNTIVLTAEKYQEAALADIVTYGKRVQSLLDQQRDIELKGKTGTARDNVFLEYNNAAAALGNELARQRIDLEKTIAGVQKKATDEAIKHAKVDADALADKIKKERELHDERRKRWNEEVQHRIRIQELEDAEAERRALEIAAENRKKIEDQGVATGGGFGGSLADSLGVGLVSIFGDKDQIKSQADFIKDVYTDLKNVAGEAIGSMISGLANLVTQWIITGNFSAKAALAMAANIAIGVAIQAGIKAIFEVAEGFAALARFDPYSASMHFAAAKTYGVAAAIAGGAGAAFALGARAAAGGQQSAGGVLASQTSGAGGTGRRDTSAQGQAYSGLPAVTDDRSRSGAFFNGEITVRIVSNDSHIINVVQDDVKNGGPMRRLILKVAEQT